MSKRDRQWRHERPLEEALAAEALKPPPPVPVEPSYWQLEEDFAQSVRGTFLTYRAGAVVSSKNLPSVVKLLKQFGAKMIPVPEAAVPFIERLSCPNCGRSYAAGR